MDYRRIRTLVLALIVCCIGLSLAVAETNTIKGKIQSINMEDESFKLETEDKKSTEYKALAPLMEDLKPGDEVLVTIDDGEVIAISPNKEDAD